MMQRNNLTAVLWSALRDVDQRLRRLEAGVPSA